MSNFARKSDHTKISRVAEVSAPIPVGDTSRAISTFAMVFDRLYADFSESLVKEYAGMRNSYMVEYQSNYDLNTSRKGDKITEVSTEIENQVKTIQELKDQKDKQKSCLSTFFALKSRQFRLRTCLSAWMY